MFGGHFDFTMRESIEVFSSENDGGHIIHIGLCMRLFLKTYF